MSVVTRFAPSPTGHLHIGGARTALFCWAYARKTAGRFVLRIEDTDQKRSSEDAVSGILDDLEWLGITWDDGPTPTSPSADWGGDPRGVGPFFQAQRLEIYNRFFDQLLDRGLAYPAFDTPEELAAMRQAAQDAKETFRYTRTGACDADAALERMKTDEHVLRFKSPDETIVVKDVVLGDIEFTPEHSDDFVIRKKDGYPTYHFAVVVDDELMGVTHVLRGQEHLNNTPKHVALQHALQHDDGGGFRAPVYAHMPLIFNADGSKMSKRDKDKAVRKAQRHEGTEAQGAPDGVSPDEFEAWIKDKTRQLPTESLVELADALGVELPEVDVEDFRRAGYLPEVVCNFIALLGWQKGDDVERFTMDEFIARFDLPDIGKSNAKFDRDKLAAFNFDTIKAMNPHELGEIWRAWAERYDPDLVTVLGDRFELAARAAQQRAKTLRELRDPIAFVFVSDDEIAFDDKAVRKVLLKNDSEGLAVLRDLRDLLAMVDSWTPESIEAAVNGFAESRDLGMGKVAQPLRVAATGTSVSPGLGETLGLLGKHSTLVRIDRCLAHVR